jgi:hypothetical protein
MLGAYERMVILATVASLECSDIEGGLDRIGLGLGGRCSKAGWQERGDSAQRENGFREHLC